MKSCKTVKYSLYPSVPAVITVICALMSCTLASCARTDNILLNTAERMETGYISDTTEAAVSTEPSSEMSESAEKDVTEEKNDATVSESVTENMQLFTPADTAVDFSNIFTLFSQYSYEAEIEIVYSFLCKGKNYYHVHIDVPGGIDFPYETDFFGEYNGHRQTYMPYYINISDEFKEGIIYFYVTFSETEFDDAPDHEYTTFVCSMAVINYRGYYFMMRNYEIPDLYDYADEYIRNYEDKNKKLENSYTSFFNESKKTLIKTDPQ